MWDRPGEIRYMLDKTGFQRILDCIPVNTHKNLIYDKTSPIVSSITKHHVICVHKKIEYCKRKKKMTESNLFACPKPVAFQGCHLNTEFHKAM